MKATAATVRDVCLALIPLLGIGWLMDLPLHFGWAVQTIEYVFVAAGLAVAGGTLAKPYRESAGALELVLALLGLAAWWWAAWNYDDWLLDAANRGPEKWLPGAVGILLMVEGMRRNCGLSITPLVIVFLIYGVVGHWLPGALEATESPPRRYVLYLYSDANAVPGIVNETWFKATEVGTYRGQCTELCGKDHGYMPIVVEVVEPEAYQAWVDTRQDGTPSVASTQQ